MNEDDTQAARGVEYARVKSTVRGGLFGGAAKPLRIGRFTVLERLGQGGMSVVYAAYDDELDRKVALKLLLPEAVKHYAPERLRREAQAIARLSHANVIPVYEVGEHEGQLFVAMEFVRGKTLRAWLGGEARPWSEVQDVLLQAASGLAAAHRAGIVHRDFKPDNVMVDEDGRVRVLDFGVAAMEVDEMGETLSEASSWNARLTQDGAIVGTPVYMAPECLARKGATILSDQFSFCAVCFEALAGKRPFSGDTIADLEAATRAGVAFPPDVSAPAEVRAAVLRGLDPNPDRRHPDMDALLHALRPKVRRRWVAPALAVGGFASAAAVYGLSTDADGCEAARENMTWTPATKTRVREAVLGGDVSLGEWDAATTALDDYAAAWVESQARSCTLVDRGEAALERALCFEWLLADLGTITAPLEQGRADRVVLVPAAVAALPAPGDCLDDRAIASLAETRRHKTSPAPEGLTTGLLSDFEDGLTTRFGAGWSPSTDILAGGTSTGEMRRAPGGHDSGHALLLTGEIGDSGPTAWSGAMVFLGEQPFAPANLQNVHTLTFWARAEPGTYAVMLFTSRTGFDPALTEFELHGQDWELVEVDLDALGPERYDVTGVFFGRVRPGRLEMRLDDVGFE